MEGTPLLPKMPPAPRPPARKFVTGVGLLLLVVLLWTGSSFITADLETGDDAYNKPFLITYLNTSAFALYLLPYLWKRSRQAGRLGDRFKNDAESREYQAIPSHPPPSARRSTSLIRSASPSLALTIHLPRTSIDGRPSVDAPQPMEVDEDAPLTTRETAELAAMFSLVWFIANWSVNASLGFTSVASSTMLAGMSGFFTLGLGRVCGVESLSASKIIAVVASFLGVVLVTTSDKSLSSSSISPASADPSSPVPSNPLLGDALALVSAVFYAIYVVFLKVKVKNEDRVDMQLMLGFVGLFNIVLLLPFFPVLHFLKWETFEMPPTTVAWTVCLVNMFITLSSDYLYVLAMLKTTPMLVTIGLSLTIPLALLGDLMLGHTASLTYQAGLGGLLVLAGFALLGIRGLQESEREEAEALENRGRTA